MSKATRQDIIKSIGAGIEYDILKEGQIKPKQHSVKFFISSFKAVFFVEFLFV